MISIIIPTLNEEKVIARLLTNLQEITSYEYEIIVSDGGSTDKTVEIAKKFAHKVIEHKSPIRQTIGFGKNVGAWVAQGQYLVFLDADVKIPDINNFFHKALNLFEKDKKLVGVTVFLKVFPEHATLSDKFFFQLVNSVHYVLNNWLNWGSASGEFQMIPASAFKAVNGYSEKLVMGEDNNMFARLSKIGRTRVETGLHVLHTSRRAHQNGWFRLLLLWMINNIFNLFFKRSFSKEWTVIR